MTSGQWANLGQRAKFTCSGGVPLKGRSQLRRCIRLCQRTHRTRSQHGLMRGRAPRSRRCSRQLWRIDRARRPRRWS